MKTYQQQGTKLQRINLSESDHICPCCNTSEHFQEAGGQYHDDAVCDDCSTLCSCKCHRPEPSEA